MTTPEGPLDVRSSFMQQPSTGAVRRACRGAKLPVCSVSQVRHTRATEVRECFGVEGPGQVGQHPGRDRKGLRREEPRTSP
jgi:hypothetical protein